MKKKLTILVLVHPDLIPPQSVPNKKIFNTQFVPWKTEFDVITSLKEIGHEILILGIYDSLDELNDLKQQGNHTQSHQRLYPMVLFHPLVTLIEVLQISYSHSPGNKPKSSHREYYSTRNIMNRAEIRLRKIMFC